MMKLGGKNKKGKHISKVDRRFSLRELKAGHDDQEEGSEFKSGFGQ
jgi:hypothetical protein